MPGGPSVNYGLTIDENTYAWETLASDDISTQTTLGGVNWSQEVSNGLNYNTVYTRIVNLTNMGPPVTSGFNSSQVQTDIYSVTTTDTSSLSSTMSVGMTQLNSVQVGSEITAGVSASFGGFGAEGSTTQSTVTLNETSLSTNESETLYKGAAREVTDPYTFTTPYGWSVKHVIKQKNVYQDLPFTIPIKLKGLFKPPGDTSEGVGGDSIRIRTETDYPFPDLKYISYNIDFINGRKSHIYRRVPSVQYFSAPEAIQLAYGWSAAVPEYATKGLPVSAFPTCVLNINNETITAGEITDCGSKAADGLWETDKFGNADKDAGVFGKIILSGTFRANFQETEAEPLTIVGPENALHQNYIYDPKSDVPSTSLSARRASKREQNKENKISVLKHGKHLPYIIDGDSIIKYGTIYEKKDWDLSDITLRGTHMNDIFHMNAANQAVVTFKGSDLVHGSKYDDAIHSRGDDVIYGKKGADSITSKSGSAAIHAGRGDDTVKIDITKHGFDFINLGEGDDSLTIELSPSAKKGGFIVEDLQLNDEFAFTGKRLDSLKATDHGHAVVYFIGNKHVGTFHNYADVIHEKLNSVLAETELNELIYLNALPLNYYENTKSSRNVGTDSMTVLRRDMFEQMALGNDLITNYKKLTAKPSKFNEALGYIIENEFDADEYDRLMQLGSDHAKEYDSMLGLYEGLKYFSSLDGVVPDDPLPVIIQ